jgi:AhpD family alkylhydroperoxidase
LVSALGQHPSAETNPCSNHWQVILRSAGARIRVAVDYTPTQQSHKKENTIMFADKVSRTEIERDIRTTLGIVPGFFERIPTAALAHEWPLFKHFELGETHIPQKYKQLLALAVHAETKCRYCTLFHTELAKLFGATDEEIQEAVHFAKHTVSWSVYLNGIRYDLGRFEDELAQVVDHARGKA